MTPEAEERAKKEAEEQGQQEEAMDPQEVQTESEEPEPKEDKSETEVPDSEDAIRPPDGNTGEMKKGSQAGSASHKNPPLQNGTSIYLRNPMTLHALIRHKIQQLLCVLNTQYIDEQSSSPN